MRIAAQYVILEILISQVRSVSYDMIGIKKYEESKPMPKRITLVEHLSTEELEQYYHHAKVGIESRQFQTL